MELHFYQPKGFLLRKKSHLINLRIQEHPPSFRPSRNSLIPEKRKPHILISMNPIFKIFDMLVPLIHIPSYCHLVCSIVLFTTSQESGTSLYLPLRISLIPEKRQPRILVSMNPAGRSHDAHTACNSCKQEKAMVVMLGGVEMKKLFEHVGGVNATDSYNKAMDQVE